MIKMKLNPSEKITSNGVETILIYLYGRRLKGNEALQFLKEIDGSILEDVVNNSGKAIYTVSKINIWKHLLTIPNFKKFIENRNIEDLQELENRADAYYVEYNFK